MFDRGGAHAGGPASIVAKERATEPTRWIVPAGFAHSQTLGTMKSEFIRDEGGQSWARRASG